MDLSEVIASTNAFGAKWSISAYRGADQTPFISSHGSALLRTASVAKVFLLLEVADRVDQGEMDASELLDRRRVARVRDSGIWHLMRVDRLPLEDVAILVGAVSDNWATNVLLERCGLPSIDLRAEAIAPGGSRLRDFVRSSRQGDDIPETLSEGCADDWALIMHKLYFDQLGTPATCQMVRRWLAQDADLSMVAGALDLDPLAHDSVDLGIELWHKTGTDVGVRADVGVFRHGTSVLSYAAICNWDDGERSALNRSAVLSAMRAVGSLLREEAELHE